MKNSKKISDSFPRALRESPFIVTSGAISRGAQTERRTGVGGLLGFLIFSAWNFLMFLTLSTLTEWNLSLLRCAGIAVLVTLWLVSTYALLNAGKRVG